MLFKKWIPQIVAQGQVSKIKSAAKNVSSEMKREIDLSRIKQILVVRTDRIGHFVMTSPLIREVKRSFPEAKVDLIIHPDNAPLAAKCPYTRRVYLYDASHKGKFGLSSSPEKAISFYKDKMPKYPYDLALVPKRDLDIHHAVFLAYLSCAPVRIGWSEESYSLKKYVNKGWNQLLTHKLDDESACHDIESALKVLEPLNIQVSNKDPELWADDEDNFKVRRKLRLAGIEGHPLVAIGIGATHVSRLWPVNYYVEVGNWLQKEFGYTLVLLGSSEEREVVEKFRSQLSGTAYNAAGDLSLRESYVLLKDCDLYLGNDSAPGHLAAAAKTTSVILSGHALRGDAESASSPERIRPWVKQGVFLQPSEKSREIKNIQVESVKEAIKKILKEKTSGE